MEQIKLISGKEGPVQFVLENENGQLGEMQVRLTDDVITVFHTEVITEAQGRGFAKALFNELVAFARRNQLTIRAFCPYVLSQFKRKPEAYRDIWKNNNDERR